MKKWTIGIDVGGTNIKFGLINDSAQITARTHLATEKFTENRKKLIEAIVERIECLIRNNNLIKRDILGVGFGLPGLINPKAGMVNFLPNIPGWENVPLKKLLEKKLKIPILLENDVNLVTLGEWKYGAGVGYKNLICITLGTGVGGGLILDGRLYRGEGFVAGEIGHMPLNEKGPICNCGGIGCFERYVGNRQILLKAKKILKKENIRRIQDIFPLASKGDKGALQVWEEIATHIGHGLVGVVNLLNPRLIIIGGGVSNNFKFLYKTINEIIAKRAMKVQSKMVKIVRAQLGDDGGILGADVLVRQRKIFLILGYLFFSFFIFQAIALAQTQDSSIPEAEVSSQEIKGSPEVVELNADTVEYSVTGNKVIAQGNVIVIHKGDKLTCDKIDFYRDTKIGYAHGNVRLETSNGAIIKGDQMAFDFNTMKGDLDKARFLADPFYGKGQTVSKVAENKIVMKRGYMTTCDLERPHFRYVSRTMDIYPKDKLVAKHVRFMVGNVPVLYLPRMTQDISGKKPLITYIPGYDKEWGMFLLSTMRYKLNDYVKGFVHFDAREKKDVAGGVDVTYETPNAGDGIIRTYYMNERNITSKRFYKPRPSPTIERERFKLDWRHKWEIDEQTKAILQYSRRSDSTFTKEYFEKEFKKEGSPSTYFLLTRVLPAGTLSFRTDKRVNRFEGGVERLPEIAYNLSNQQIGGDESKFYFRNITTYSNLASKAASPTEVRLDTQRVDVDSDISYLEKISFVELKPFVGGKETYYTKTKDPAHYHIFRGQFKTGATLSTKFYKVWDIKSNFWQIDIQRLRHVITPTINYSYDHDPTVPSTALDSYDGIDSLQRRHNINFALENKLQTKRGGQPVDLFRVGINSDFHLKEHPAKGGFDTVISRVELTPRERFRFFVDSTYDTKDHKMKTVNFDFYINEGDPKWSWNVGKRYSPSVYDELTSELRYQINPKWKFRMYDLFDFWNGGLKEQEYSVTRDLHCWEMEINFNEKRNLGNEIWLVFRLKAFPDLLLDLATSFNKRKVGSQSWETPP